MVSMSEPAAMVVPLTSHRKLLVTVSPSASDVEPAVQVSVSVSVAVRGERVADVNTGGVLSMVTVEELIETPASVPSVGVTVQETLSPFWCADEGNVLDVMVDVEPFRVQA